MLPELKQAIIKHLPDYFSWDQDRQEQYRVNIPEQDYLKVEQFLLKALFDITVTDKDQMDEVKGDLTDVQSTKFNATLLPLQGIGENYFWLNEYFPESKTLLSFETLYDYDFQDHQFQQEAKEKDLKGYQKKAYRGSLYFIWARLMIKKQFYYARLTMASGYIYSKLDEYGQDYIKELIPHEYVQGKNHGVPDKEGFLWDYKPDAGGFERQLEELKYRFWDYTKNALERLEKEFDKVPLQQVLIFDEGNPSESQFIFSGSLSDIRNGVWVVISISRMVFGWDKAKHSPIREINFDRQSGLKWVSGSSSRNSAFLSLNSRHIPRVCRN